MLNTAIALPYACAIITQSPITDTLRSTLHARFPNWDPDTAQDAELLRLIGLVGALDLRDHLDEALDISTLAPIQQAMFTTFARMVWHIERRESARQHLPEGAPERCRVKPDSSDPKAILAAFIKDRDDCETYINYATALIGLCVPYLDASTPAEDAAWEQAYKHAGLSPSDDEVDALDGELAYWAGSGATLAFMARDLMMANCLEAFHNPFLLSADDVKLHVRGAALRWEKISGFAIKKGKMLDIVASLLGHTDGYQQMKPGLIADNTVQSARQHYHARFLETVSLSTKQSQSLLAVGEPPKAFIGAARAMADIDTYLKRPADAHGDVLEVATLVTEMFGHLAQARFAALLSQTAPLHPRAQAWSAWHDDVAQKNRYSPSGERDVNANLDVMTEVLLRFCAVHQGDVRTPTSRPCEHDEIIHRHGLAPIAKKMNGDLETMVDLYSPHNDGFEYAMDLRDDGWDIGSDDVDELDGAIYTVGRLYSRLCWLWNDVTRPVLPVPIGKRVSYFSARSKEEGVITDVYDHEPATYCILRDTQEESDTSRLLIKFENVTAI